MSDDNPEWFAAKRYGYGAGLPISWQGWALTLAYVAIAGVALVFFRERPVALIAVLVPVTALLVVISARTTRGGWRWRWGDSD